MGGWGIRASCGLGGKEAPDISIYNWDTGVAVQKYEVMEETARTADSIRYAWKWNPRNIPCGVYVGVTNFRIGGKPVIGNIVEKRVRVFLKRENGKLIKAQVCQFFCVNGPVLFLGMGCRGRGQFPLPGPTL
jgi:hypothetical protein